MSKPVRLSTRFKISIPKSVLLAQSWKAGQELVLIPKGSGVLVMPSPELETLRGITRDADGEGFRDRHDES